MNYRLKVLTPPAEDPVDFATLKRHIKADGDTDNNIIKDQMHAARELVEDHTGLTMINTTFQMIMDCWPVGERNDEWWDGVREGAITELEARTIELPTAPLISVTHIKTYDEAGVATTFAPSNYFVDSSGRKPRIGLKSSASWPIPGRTLAGIEIEFVAGYGTEWKDVDATLRLGLMMQVAYTFNHRGDAAKLDTSVLDIIDRKRIKRVY